MFGGIFVVFVVVLALVLFKVLRDEPLEVGSSDRAATGSETEDAGRVPAAYEAAARDRRAGADDELNPAAAVADGAGDGDTAPAADAPDPGQLLLALVDAAGRITDLEFDFDSSGADLAAPWVPQYSGHARLRYTPENREGLFLLSGELVPLEGQRRGSSRFRLAGDRTTLMLADDSAQTLAAFQRGAMPSFRSLDLVLHTIGVLFEPQQLREALSSPGLAWEGTSSVDGVECQAVRFGGRRGTDQWDSVWYIGTDDALPRRVDWIEPGTSGDYRVTLRMRNLDTDIVLELSQLQIDVPRSYAAVRGQQPFWWALPPGTMAPEFELRDSSGDSLSLGSLEGNLTVLDFRDHCAAVPFDLQELHVRYHDAPVRVVGIHAVQVRRPGVALHDPLECLEALGLTYPMLLEGEDVARLYNVHNTGFPMRYLIDDSGRILFTDESDDWVALGKAVADRLDEMAQEALAAEAGDGVVPVALEPDPLMAPGAGIDEAGGRDGGPGARARPDRGGRGADRQGPGGKQGKADRGNKQGPGGKQGKDDRGNRQGPGGKQGDRGGKQGKQDGPGGKQGARD